MNWLHYQDQIFPIEIACTPAEQAIGLMGVTTPYLLAFPFAKKAIHQFWMKNTPSPLDIVFLNQNKIVELCQGIPFDLQKVGKFPSDLVIEAPLGFAKSLGLASGKEMKISYHLQTLSKLFQLKLIKEDMNEDTSWRT